LLSGDCNTKYFHLATNGKHRKTRIFRLEQDEGVIEGDENLKKFITNYYKDHDMLQAKELKLVLSTFEQLSGLKINFYKSELLCYGAANKDCELKYAHLFGCRLGDFPFRYLGIAMNHVKLSNKDWSCIEERFQKKLSS
jgi:hypothetical protein